MEKFSSTQKEVQDYYGKTLHTNQDLVTNACCIGESSFPAHHQAVLSKVHPDVISKFYGCGSPIPDLVEGATVLDLGSGSGRDVYLAAGLVGERGRVIGVDMTPEQVEVAKKYEEYHRQQFGLQKSNVEFVLGTIEDLKSHNIEDNSIDIVISNCVLNLVSDKGVVLKEIFRVLKEGGELFFSDVYADRRIPAALQRDKVLWGECLSGALYIEDFRRLMQRVGFLDYRVVKRSAITINNKEVQEMCGDIKFESLTIRAFKLGGLEDRCEDYGQKVTYLGGVEGQEETLCFDAEHCFKKGETVKVCMNTALMLGKTRFAKFFQVTDPGRHLGLFDCSSGASGCAKGNCCGSEEKPAMKCSGGVCYFDA